MTEKHFLSTKTYTHAEGLSCAFRQWRAGHTHCRFLHGYALEVKITFARPEGLDEHNWVMDFGGLKSIKQWLQDTFDHKTVVAEDDPHLDTFRQLHANGIIDIVIVEHVGCEKFAELIFDCVERVLAEELDKEKEVFVTGVEVKEHAGNSAVCLRAANLGEEADV